MTPPIRLDRLLTLQEFFEFEQATPIHHEFIAGEVYARAGASKRHHRVLSNIHLRTASAAANGPCGVYVEGVRLQVGSDIYYPDLMVECSAIDADELTVTEPCLLIEITSPATARIDRTSKLDAYCGIPSLKTYLIVEQAWRRVVRHWRDANGTWQQEDLRSDGAIMLPCPEVILTLDQIYQGLAPLTVREMEALGYGAEGAPPITAPA
ncbi:MAG: Uma2 family endonuclease [Gemmatimonadaceae bacterium]